MKKIFQKILKKFKKMSLREKIIFSLFGFLIVLGAVILIWDYKTNHIRMEAEEVLQVIKNIAMVTYQDEGGKSYQGQSEIVETKIEGLPVISEVSVSGITDSSAIIHWKTDRKATSQVEYGTSTSYGSKTNLDTTLSLSHNVVLRNLTPSTTYHFRVRSISSGGAEAISGDYNFTTSSPPPKPIPKPKIKFKFSLQGRGNHSIKGNLKITSNRGKKNYSIESDTGGEGNFEAEESDAEIELTISLKIPGFLTAKKSGIILKKGETIVLDFGEIKVGDFNNDGVIDIADFSLFSANWRKTGESLYDVNQNQIVDIEDFSITFGPDNWQKKE